MDDLQDKIINAKAAIEETEAKSGEASLETSYKWDELAAALKEAGQLLDAANASAKAKTIRASIFAKESEQQRQKIGDVSVKKDLTAVAALKILYRAAIGLAVVTLAIAIFLPSKSMGSFLTREAMGSVAAATLVQLFLFPIKTIPRILKYIIVAVISGIIWTVLGNRT